MMHSSTGQTKCNRRCESMYNMIEVCNITLGLLIYGFKGTAGGGGRSGAWR